MFSLRAARLLEHVLVTGGVSGGNRDEVIYRFDKWSSKMRKYRVVFLTGPPDLQYQNEKQVAANQD